MQTFVKKSLSIIGLGYVGLCTAVCFADRGFRVYGVEIDKKKREMISSGRVPFHEKGLESMLRSNLDEGRFLCTPDFDEAIKQTEITFVTVGTPSKSDGSIDLSYIESAVAEIGKAIRSKRGYHLVVIKSTVAPGTTQEKIKAKLQETSGKVCGRDFGLCVNPEFLREGSAIYETFRPDALVIGSYDKKATESLLQLYREFYNVAPRTIVTSLSNAEFVKYSINAFRATQLSFLNTLANICENVPSADVVDVIEGLSAVTKIDKRYLKAGLGFGGSCLPKDLRALIATAKELDIDPSILQAAEEVNEKQPQRVVNLVKKIFGGVEGRKIAVLGLAFKAQTDDVRESVAVRIASSLAAAGASVVGYDPKASQNAKNILGDSVSYAHDAHSCIRGSDCCIIATGWEEFRDITPSEFHDLMKIPIVIDGWRLLDASRFKTANVLLHSLGRHHGKSEEEEQRQQQKELVAPSIQNKRSAI